MKNVLKSISLSCALGALLVSSTSFAADIGTVNCNSYSGATEIDISVGSISYNDWWNYNSVAVHGITSDNKLVQVGLKRLNLLTQSYSFSYDGDEQFNKVDVFLTGDSKSRVVTCNN
ncbi:hypothetical protein [Pseudoalteromonas denitrificans]|uniref:Uncharacterized protein n=1 Tax=Pseudoalteromonas denitrificans DSM 6059 TaxID=1123010 RepID=A0A1I1RVC7_9GAMM|nr:hypothetical protein [Pseudoalteromonas denitrificans]SFD34610.1 hypothetical protein SAMN02745724_04264 [Pseudoalteromonas denitrificans DSM 6059]